jgi:hypothetical protein
MFTSMLVALGGAMVSMLSIGPKFPKSNTVEDDGLLRAIQAARLPSEGK